MTILQLRQYQKKDADLDAVAASGLAAAWTAYTPTVTAASGTFTTVSASGRYLNIGKLTFVQINVVVTTNGTAAGNVQATLPNTAFNTNYVMTGREILITGKQLEVVTSTTKVLIFNYDGTYPAGSGYSLMISGCYENT